MLLVAFMIPASGLMVYVHHCNMSNNTVLDLESSSSCCGASAKKANHCLVDNSSAALAGTIISAPPCCVESNLFLKLTSDALLHSLQLMHVDVAVVPSITNINILLSEENLTSDILPDFTEFPPGAEHYIMFSSLRL